MKLLATLTAATCFLALSLPATAQQAPKKPTASQCFYSNRIENWKATDAKTIYLRVGLQNYYRLDLANACQALKWPGAFLITKIHGPNLICGAVDWDLHVATSWRDIPQACIVKKMTKLSKEDAAALPQKFKP